MTNNTYIEVIQMNMGADVFSHCNLQRKSLDLLHFGFSWILTLIFHVLKMSCFYFSIFSLICIFSIFFNYLIYITILFSFQRESCLPFYSFSIDSVRQYQFLEFSIIHSHYLRLNKKYSAINQLIKTCEFTLMRTSISINI